MVTTPRDSGKLKRLRNNTRVELVPCGRFGKPKRGHHLASGVAEILDDAASVTRVTALLLAKMPIEYRLIMKLEGAPGSEIEKRVAIRITPALPDQD